MRRYLTGARWLILITVLAGSLVAVQPLHAQSYAVARYTLDGGGRAAGSGLTVLSVIGQADAGIHTGGGLRLFGGFLLPQRTQTQPGPDPDPEPQASPIYLPALGRGD